MARPRPLLPAAREREESPRANRSKTLGRNDSGMPGPSSSDGDLDPALGLAAPAAATPRPASRAACGCGRWPAGWPRPGAAGAGRRRPAPAPPAGRAASVWSGAGGVRVADRVDRPARTGRPARGSSGRPVSSRASSSRSSTSEVIRSAADSTRSIAWAICGGASARCGRDSSAYPRIAASGVRSSWLASATNWRTFISLACRAASALSTWPSMWFSAEPTWPTSVRGSVSAAGTRTGSATSPWSSGSSADPAGGGRDPAQRAQVEPDDEEHDERGRDQAAEGDQR